MNISNILIISLFTYLTVYVLSLISKKNRNNIISLNKNLDKLRKIKVKSVEEQKKFIGLKYPKRGKFKFKWPMIFYILGYMILIGGIWYGYFVVLDYLKIVFKLWQALLIIMIVPILINMILKRFNLQRKNDLLDYFK